MEFEIKKELYGLAKEKKDKVSLEELRNKVKDNVKNKMDVDKIILDKTQSEK